MSAYEDTLLAARFAARAPEPVPGDWNDVLDRAGMARKGRGRLVPSHVTQGSRRRRILVLAAATLVLAVATASAYGVRVLLAETGIVGLAPFEATPSTPEKGELILHFTFAHSWGDPGRFTVLLYADGRLISERVGDPSRTDEQRNSTGFLERRLTPEGVELVTAEVVSTELFDHDLHLLSGHGLYSGRINFRNGDRLVHVIWGDGTWDDVGPRAHVAKEEPTPEQASALKRLDARLADPDSWLPASAWKTPDTKAFVPSGYQVCYSAVHGVGLSEVLALLPPAAEELLRSQERTHTKFATFALWCSDLTNAESRALAGILDGGGIDSHEDVFGAWYGVYGRELAGATEFSLGFVPLVPHQGEGGKK